MACSFGIFAADAQDMVHNEVPINKAIARAKKYLEGIQIVTSSFTALKKNKVSLPVSPLLNTFEKIEAPDLLLCIINILEFEVFTIKKIFAKKYSLCSL